MWIGPCIYTLTSRTSSLGKPNIQRCKFLQIISGLGGWESGREANQTLSLKLGWERRLNLYCDLDQLSFKTFQGPLFHLGAKWKFSSCHKVAKDRFSYILKSDHKFCHKTTPHQFSTWVYIHFLFLLSMLSSNPIPYILNFN